MSEPVDISADQPVDPWQTMRLATQARIGLGRSGHAMPTSALLAFQSAHALARDAVHTELDVEQLQSQLESPALVVHSAAPDRPVYLQRPDLGRQLSPDSRVTLEQGEYDAVFVIADGLSARAVLAHAPALMKATCERLPDWTFAPVVIAVQSRVALADEVAVLVGAQMAVVLIGERPGLSSSDSLGVYLTYDPHPGRLDSERNCISNVRPPMGQSIAHAAETLSHLMISAKRRKLTGTALKDDSGIHASATVIELP